MNSKTNLWPWPLENLENTYMYITHWKLLQKKHLIISLMWTLKQENKLYLIVTLHSFSYNLNFSLTYLIMNLKTVNFLSIIWIFFLLINIIGLNLYKICTCDQQGSCMGFFFFIITWTCTVVYFLNMCFK